MSAIAKTTIGQSVIDLARRVAAGEVIHVPFDPRPLVPIDRYTPGAVSTIDTLKTKVDEVRNLLGQAAVNELLGELPKAALDALRAVNADLGLEAGQSPYLAYKQSIAALRGFEETLRAQQKAYESAIKPWAYKYEARNTVDVVQRTQDEGQLARANPTASPEARAAWIAETRDVAATYNEGIRKAFPYAPPELLMAGPFMEGPGTLTRKAMDDMLVSPVPGQHGSQFERVAGMSKLRAMWPEYVATAKKAAALEGHLREKGLPSAAEIAAMKSELYDRDVSVPDLFGEVQQLIGRIEGFAAHSTIKRETLSSSSKSSTTSRSASFGDVGDGVAALNSMSTQSSSTERRSTREVLNVAARTYVVEELSVEAAAANGRKDLLITPLERELLMEQLLAARRIYEAMVVREPDSLHVAALAGWMTESTVEIHGAKDRTLKMGELRADIIATEASRPERLAILREELALGGAQATSKLSRMRSLAAL